jgi:hypothetical protein
MVEIRQAEYDLLGNRLLFLLGIGTASSASDIPDTLCLSSKEDRTSGLDEVAVGTIIADRPPHRSARALISACGSYLG